MRVKAPSLAALHAFLAGARQGGFRSAAQSLRVTQGAVSRAVLRLMVKKPGTELEAAARCLAQQDLRSSRQGSER